MSETPHREAERAWLNIPAVLTIDGEKIAARVQNLSQKGILLETSFQQSDIGSTKVFVELQLFAGFSLIKIECSSVWKTDKEWGLHFSSLDSLQEAVIKRVIEYQLN